MAIFDVIKYEGNNDVLVWKFPGEDFTTLSQLIVHESQEAAFVKDGQILDIFKAGRHTLHSQNIPLLRKLVNLPFGGVSPFHCEVYFINKAASMDVVWATDKPMPIQDAKYKIILPVDAAGQFGVRVYDSKQLLVGLVGTINKFDQATLRQYFKGILLTNIKDCIATQFVENQVSFLEIHARIKAISNGIRDELSEEFSKYGIDLINFNVSEIIPPENDPSYIQLKKALAKKAEMSVIGYTYQQERTFDVLDAAAVNEGAGANIMNVGMGLGMGLNVGGAIGGAMGTAVRNITPDVGPSSTEWDTSAENESVIKCPNCGNKLPDKAKFCLECGAKIEPPLEEGFTICPGCGEKVPKGKFCLECGAKLIKICSQCGAEIVEGAKFCLECGSKL